jgi:hypothetical protein
VRPDSIGKTGDVRSRALLLLALVGGLAVGSGVAAAAVGAGDRTAPASRVAATRADLADAATTGAVARVRDQFENERGGRRADIATLTAALVLAAGAVWWIIRSRQLRLATARHGHEARPRGPPDLPALVSI